jgi:dTDP-4-dehydrorhamnose reductase
LSRKEVDYSNTGKLASYLKDIKPTFTINAAGYTGKPNVDACELAKAECLSGNAVLPGIIREVCEDLNIPWGHVSSGCIYSARVCADRLIEKITNFCKIFNVFDFISYLRFS